ncbi:MAG: DUF192 domain-containing protein [Candidatus Gribaldobacteria bacterium]|nr:DUF192 domain-containing protein [Candidatus Gribaldobacteria bacterium]
MKKLFFGVLIIVVIGAIFLGFYFKKNSQVCFQNNCFKVEVAQTEAKRERGLMLRKSLAGDAGMFFIFDQASVCPFWMKNTLIPLDMIWLNQNKEIVFLAQNVPPCTQGDSCSSITPDQPAKYVLELNAGQVAKLNLKIGDKLQTNF